MDTLYNANEKKIFFAAERYPKGNKDARSMGLLSPKNVEMRSMTIAAFHVAQNSTELDGRLMNARLLRFLLAGSDTAIRHWCKAGRLEKERDGFRLTDTGLEECSTSLNSEVQFEYSTSNEKVHEWIERMLAGDKIARKEFNVKG